MAKITAPSFFFHGLSTPAGSADALEFEIPFFEFSPSFGNSLNVEARQVRDASISASTEPHRFESGVESSLLFVERAQEQDDGRAGFVRHGPDRAMQHPEGLDRDREPSGEKLLTSSDGIRRTVEVEAREILTGEPLGADQSEERLLHLDL
jgi:hypothetical protein